MGIGANRNQQCWCGSGKKLKHCHLDREQQKPILPWEAGKALRKAFSTEICSAPKAWHQDCSGKIVRAHTVPRSSSLTKIARDGHVYAFIPSFENLTKNKGRLVPELYGIGRASTFTGFCSRHDDRIFDPIEKVEFVGSPEQCFLLGFRAISREAYTKAAAASLSDFRREADRGRDVATQAAIQSFNSSFDAGTNAGLQDILGVKTRYENVLISGDYSDVRALVMDLDEPPAVMCSASWMPSLDFDGNRLQDLSDLTIPAREMTFSSFWGGQHGAIVLQWLEDSHDVCVPFVESLLRVPRIHLTAALLRLMFEHFENVQISPSWWDSLEEETRQKLIARMSLSANPMALRKNTVLQKQDFSVAEWPIADVRTIGF